MSISKKHFHGGAACGQRESPVTRARIRDGAHIGWIAVFVMLWAGADVARATQDERRPDLTEASLETLMNMEVSSPARKEQKLSRTPSAVYVVTQEDIRRSGATSIPDVLRMVPGLQVAQISAHEWVVTARGFASRFADKVLVLIDGRSVYNNLYSGVYWDQNDVPLEDIERIEVIRGPGATMWGADAVNGVINIITKPAQDTQGFLASTGAGNEDRGLASLRYGGKIGDDAFYRLYTKYSNRGPLKKSTGQPGHDSWDSTQGGGRLDWKISERDSLSISGDVYSGAAEETIFPDYPANLAAPIGDSIGFSGGFGLVRWTRRYSERSDIALQFSFSDERRNEGFGSVDARIADLDFQHHLALSARHDLMWGLGMRVNSDQTATNSIAGVQADIARFIPASTAQPLGSVFLEDAISLVPDRLVLTAGIKLEHNVYTGWETQPTVRLAWTPSIKQAWWAAVSRAVRTPARGERDLFLQFQPLPAAGVLGILSGNDQFHSEKVWAYEAGYRQQPARWVTLDLAMFFSNYSDVKSETVGAPFLQLDPEPQLIIPVTFANNTAGHTFGFELATNWSLTHSWRLSGNYSWFRYVLDRTRLGPRSIPLDQEGTSPGNQVQIRSQWDISRKFSLDTSLYYVSALPGMGVPAYARTDARLGWRASRAVEVSLVGQNLLNGRHLEFVSNDYVVGGEPGRTAYLKVTWSF